MNTSMLWRVAVADTVGFALEMYPGPGGGMGLDALLSDFDGDPFNPEINNVPGNYILCAAGRAFADLQAQRRPELYGCPICYPSLRLCRFVCRAWEKEWETPRQFPYMPALDAAKDTPFDTLYKPYWG